MSINGDYWAKTVGDQSIRELHARAAEERLASIAIADRPGWWQRLTARRAGSTAGRQMERLRQRPVAR